MRIKSTALVAAAVMASLSLSAPVYADKQMDSKAVEQAIKIIQHNPNLTPAQKKACIEKLRPHRITPQLLLSTMGGLVVVGYGTKIGLAVKKRKEELRKDREKYQRRVDRHKREWDEILAPEEPKQEDPFVVLQRLASAIPVEQRTASFFTSRPINKDDATAIPILIGGVRVPVDVSSDEAADIRRGKMPLVRTFTIKSVTRPWYEWAGYEPYDHYWPAVAAGWFWPDSLTKCGWTDVDKVGDDIAAYTVGERKLTVDWADATRTRSGVLYRWSLEKRPMSKALNPALASSYRPPRPLSASGVSIHEAALLIGLDGPAPRVPGKARRKKARPRGGAYAGVLRANPQASDSESKPEHKRKRVQRLRKSLNKVASTSAGGASSAAQDGRKAASSVDKAAMRKVLAHPTTDEPIQAVHEPVAPKADRPTKKKSKGDSSSKRPEMRAANNADPASVSPSRDVPAGASTFWDEAPRASTAKATEIAETAPFPVAWKEQIKMLHRELEETIQSTIEYDEDEDMIEAAAPETMDDVLIPTRAVASADSDRSRLDFMELGDTSDADSLIDWGEGFQPKRDDAGDLPGYSTDSWIPQASIESSDLEFGSSEAVRPSSIPLELDPPSGDQSEVDPYFAPYVEEPPLLQEMSDFASQTPAFARALELDDASEGADMAANVSSAAPIDHASMTQQPTASEAAAPGAPAEPDAAPAAPTKRAFRLRVRGAAAADEHPQPVPAPEPAIEPTASASDAPPPPQVTGRPFKKRKSLRTSGPQEITLSPQTWPGFPYQPNPYYAPPPGYQAVPPGYSPVPPGYQTIPPGYNPYGAYQPPPAQYPVAPTAPHLASPPPAPQQTAPPAWDMQQPWQQQAAQTPAPEQAPHYAPVSQQYAPSTGYPAPPVAPVDPNVTAYGANRTGYPVGSPQRREEGETTGNLVRASVGSARQSPNRRRRRTKDEAQRRPEKQSNDLNATLIELLARYALPQTQSGSGDKPSLESVLLQIAALQNAANDGHDTEKS
ncbi:MAG TPA: hypothetical protein VGK19_23715 [Capsulimonadaceae bacterium]